MSIIKSTCVALALIGAVGIAGTPQRAQAITLSGFSAGTGIAGEAGALVHKVQRRRGGARRGGGIRRGGGGFRRGGRRVFRGRRGIRPGAAAAIGLGLGVLGAIAAQNAARAREGEYYDAPPPPPAAGPGYDPDVEYCIRRFRSYNPETGYYKGFDGRYHRCP